MASSIDRLPAHTRSAWLKALSRNFHPLGKDANVKRESAIFRRAALLGSGIILIEANVVDRATHKIAVSAESGATVTATGGTPASFAATGGWDEITYATAGPKLITAVQGSAKGEASITVP